jgi:hypothetical protein
VLDIDTVKGCSGGMKANPDGGCYGLCYANRIAECRGFDFSVSVSRQPKDDDALSIEKLLNDSPATWFRIGTMGDPSHDWALTFYICEWLGRIKIPVIVTKHWHEMPRYMIKRLAALGVVFNTSISALDSTAEREYRLGQYFRLAGYGARSVLRIVSCNFGDTDEGRYLENIQNWLFMYRPFIDNPLRIPTTDKRVTEGTIKVRRMTDLGGGSTVSVWDESCYIGPCEQCPDQCGVNFYSKKGRFENANRSFN